MTPDKKWLSSSFPFHQEYKVKIAALLIEHWCQHVSPIPGPVACFASHLCSWHTNHLFSYILSQHHVLPPTYLGKYIFPKISKMRNIFSKTQNISSL